MPVATKLRLLYTGARVTGDCVQQGTLAPVFAAIFTDVDGVTRKCKTPPQCGGVRCGCALFQSAAIATAASGDTLTLVRRLSFGENSTTPSISEKIV